MIPRLYNVAEVGDIFGVAPNTLRTWVLRRLIPYVKVGKSIRFREDDLLKWIDANTVASLPVIQKCEQAAGNHAERELSIIKNM